MLVTQCSQWALQMTRVYLTSVWVIWLWHRYSWTLQWNTRHWNNKRSSKWFIFATCWNESLPKSYLWDRSYFLNHPCSTDSAAPQLLHSGAALLRSSICSINCLNAQLVSGSRLASSTRRGGDASRETAGPPAPLAGPLMVIRRAAGRPRCVEVRKRWGKRRWVWGRGVKREGGCERERERGRTAGWW